MESTSKKLTRSSEEKVIGGVCGGIAEYLEVDPTMVRLATAALVIFGVGSVIPLYFVLWMVMPEAE